MPKLLLMNGPAGIGKDAAITHLQNRGFDLIRREAKCKLHILVMEMFSIPKVQYFNRYNDRSLKELPFEKFAITTEAALDLCKILPSIAGRETFEGYIHLSIREVLIYMSEVVCKPALGKDYFGRERAAALQPNEHAYDTSAGFVEELPPAISKLGQSNITLIRVHSKDKTFGDNDSRDYIPQGVIDNTYDVHNNGTLQEYLTQIEDIVSVRIPRHCWGIV